MYLTNGMTDEAVKRVNLLSYLLAKTLFASAILCVSSLLRTAFPMFLEASVSSLVNFETVSRPDRLRQAARIQRIARADPR